MEYLMDDTMNSNILSSCPSCGLSSSLCTSSTERFIQCENCKRAIDSALVNNNPMIQTHQDFVALPNLTRPRCCSCLEKSSTATSTECSTSVGDLDIPLTRPRSTSSPDQYSVRDGQPCTLELSSASDSVCQNPLCIPAQSSHEQHSHHLVSHSDVSCDQCSSPAPLSRNSSDSLTHGSSIKADTVVRNEGAKDSAAPPCPNCGGVSVVGAVELETPELTSVCANINTQQNVSCGGIISSTDPTKVVETPSHPATSANSESVQSEDSPERASTWSKKTRGPLPKTDDTKAQKAPSKFKQFLELPSEEVVNNHKTHFHKRGFDSPPLHITSSQIISHNIELNRIRTAAARRTPQSSRSSRIIHRDIHLGVAASRPTRHSLHTPSDIPRIVTPDSPLSGLPLELQYELHDLYHENEDLSADVVYSLHFRDYQIEQLLGTGISSTVRRVTEKSTGAEFAVKIIDISGEKGEISQVEQVKKDTFREIKILRMCAGHPNIIELHDVFETPTFIFLVFEICRKGELFDYLTSVVSLSEKRTRIFMRQLIEAVEYIHDKNIVHRDLKPENILLDDNLNIKVSDFGFATVIEQGEELTELCGTPGYLAPEVLAHSMYENVSGYGKEVDMWACGVIMYTLLCGAPPFWNRRQMMMLRAIMNAEYTFNSPEWDDITDAPKNLIQKLLVVNPKDRLTAKEALKHPFFHSQIPEEKKFQARRKFRAAAACVVFFLRLRFYYKHPPPISADMVRSNPYGIKILRKVIDTCAFSMYKHWVKRVDNQNRAALFEHTLRDDWKHTPMIIDGIKL